MRFRWCTCLGLMLWIQVMGIPTLGQSGPPSLETRLQRATSLARNFPTQAYQLALTAFQEAEQSADTRQLARARLALGQIQWYQGAYRPAQEQVQQALQTFQLLGDSLLIAESWLTLGTIDWRAGNFLGASEFYLKAQKIFERQLDTPGLAKVFYWEGIVKADLENYPGALQDYQHALHLAEYMADTLLQANVLNFVGRAYRKQKMYDSALLNHRQSLIRYEWLGDEVGISDYYNNVGSIYRRTGRFDSAAQYFRQALTIQEELQDKEGMADGYIDLGRTLGQMRQYNAAIEYVNRGLEVAQTAGLKDDVRYAYQTLAGIYDSINNIQAAFDYMQRYEAVKESLYASQMQYKLNHMRFSYENEKLLTAQERERERVRRNLLTGVSIAVIIIVLLGVLGAFWYRKSQQEQKLNRQLETQNILLAHERARSDNLLLNILPGSIAEVLKGSATGRVTPRFHPDVSVMFVDFKGFTVLSETLTPQKLVHELHECFREFDTIVDKHGLEKIKTIGDAYMCAGGLPNALTDHALGTVRAGLDIHSFMEARADKKRKQQAPFFQARVGIHSGPVVAGVVGKHKFAYDIWGDTVNTAARLESSGEVGKVNISSETYQRIQEIALCTPRGKIKAKNKGEVEMYFVDWIA